MCLGIIQTTWHTLATLLTLHTLGSAPVTPMCDPVWFEDSQLFTGVFQ